MTVLFEVYSKKYPLFDPADFSLDIRDQEMQKREQTYVEEQMMWKIWDHGESGTGTLEVRKIFQVVYPLWKEDDERFPELKPLRDKVYQGAQSQTETRKKFYGLGLPSEFLQEAERNSLKKPRGAVRTDRRLARILCQHPDIREVLHHCEPLWAMTLLLQGKQGYQTTMTTSNRADYAMIETAQDVANTIAGSSDGFVWNNLSGLVTWSIKKMYDAAKEEEGYVDELLKSVGTKR